MRVNRNIKIIILVFACAYGMLCFRYVSLQILQRDEFRKKTYVRKEQQDRIEQYVLQGDITLRKGKPHVDSRRILAKDRATVASLADNGFFRRSGEGISLDANALVVSNPRLNHSRDITLRGSIRDRENRLLAWSTINGQRQVRHYSGSIPDFHTVGYIHPVFGKSGLEKSTDSFLRGSADGWRGALAWLRNPNQG